MQAGRFTKINTEFHCENCGFLVPKAKKTCRNHCPQCLTSKHVDCNPGDRENMCLGLMKAVAHKIKKANEIDILFECNKCHEQKINKACRENSALDDSLDMILKLPAF